jgi:hypothetical protein
MSNIQILFVRRIAQSKVVLDLMRSICCGLAVRFDWGGHCRHCNNDYHASIKDAVANHLRRWLKSAGRPWLRPRARLVPASLVCSPSCRDPCRGSATRRWRDGASNRPAQCVAKPGRQYRPDESGRQIRVPPRLQVLDLRHLVGPGKRSAARSPSSPTPSASPCTWSSP